MLSQSQDVSCFSYFRRLNDVSAQKRNEAKIINHIAFKLHSAILINDIDFGPDPPDFVLTTEGKHIGLELTRLTRQPCKKGVGDADICDYRKWDQERLNNPPDEASYHWKEFCLADTLKACDEQLNSKAKKELKASCPFDDHWLLFYLAEGTPASVILGVGQHVDPRPGGIEYAKRERLRFLFEISEVLRRDTVPFSTLIFFHSFAYIALTRNDNPFGLLGPTPHELELGRQAPSLTTRIGVTTLKRHLEGKSGTISWATSPTNNPISGFAPLKM